MPIPHRKLLQFFILIMVIPGIVHANDASTADDWPTFQHDQARSGATNATLPKDPVESWVYRSPSPPRAAWDEPALWDGWSKIHNLTNRQVYDKVFHVAVVGNSLYFGSSVDDKVYSLDAATGRVQWTFFTEGPVRLAPVVVDGKVYVGSDDGYVYCLAAHDGRLLWKHRPGPQPRRIPGNERIISPWAIRTGVIVQGNRLYCGAGVIPSEGVYVCAIDTNTGQEVWKTAMHDLPAQGYLLASATRLYVVTGRDRPLVFDVTNGERLHQVSGGTGGTYALLADDNLFFGPNKTGEVTMVGAQSQDVLASFAGDHMIIAKPFSYLYGEKHLSALDRQTYVSKYADRQKAQQQLEKSKKELEKAGETASADLKAEVTRWEKEVQDITMQMAQCVKWRLPLACPLAMVLAKDTLLTGGHGHIAAVGTENGELLWRRELPGRAFGLAVAGGRMFVSTDQGTIHAFTNASSSAPVPQPEPQKPEASAVVEQEYVGPFSTEEMPPAVLHGPFAEFTRPGQVRISWRTESPMTSVLEWGIDVRRMERYEDATPKTDHEFLLDQISPGLVYRFRISGQGAGGTEFTTDPYQFDSHFDYLPVAVPDRPSPFPQDARRTLCEGLAKNMIELSGVRRGYALVIGAKDGQLAYEIARQSELHVVIVESDPLLVNKIRTMVDQAGLHGTRVSVHRADGPDLPFGPYLFNLITTERPLEKGTLPDPWREAFRCLRPTGGTLVAGHEPGTAAARDLTPQGAIQLAGCHAEGIKPLSWEQGNFAYYKRDKLAGSGEWSHQYAGPDNGSCSQDERVQGALAVQWWGRPGARPMPDRGNRNPAPVSANGRLYIQGNRTLFSLDAYNGTILWSKQIPNMRRANVPRDGSNMVASQDHLWVSMGSYCVGFDGQTGTRLLEHRNPMAESSRNHQWGFVSRVDQLLVGSGVRGGSQYQGDRGEWYDTFGDRDIARVASDHLFAMQWYTGQPIWKYQQGVIMNSTITIGNGRIYFIESRNPAAKQAATGRLLAEILQEQYLVALDLATGKIAWERPFDFSQCESVTYITYNDETLIVSGTDKKGGFHTYAFDAPTGNDLWHQEAPDKKGHHTGHLAHPTMVGDRVYFNKHTYALRTGEILEVEDFNWHGCGVMSASRNSIFSRYEYHGMFDLKTKTRTEFLGLRSGCWLSLIPSGGLLLAPETSAGCSCGHALQTSIAYVPTSDLQP